MSLFDNVRESMRRDKVFDFVAEDRYPFSQGRRVINRDQVDLSHGTVLYMENITVSFDGFKALNDLSLYLNVGELRCIIGPNGAGKTTMMDVITGKTRADEGSVFFGQTMDLSKMSEYEIASAGIGRKFQKPTIFPKHTVFQNLELAMRANKNVWPALIQTINAEQNDRIEEVKQIIGLADLSNLEAEYLSHGQKQWLEIGMLLMQDPLLLLVDEPVAGMTHQEMDKTAELLTGLAGEHTVVVVEHDMDFVRSIANKVTVLHEGHVLAEGSMDAMQSDAKVRQVYLGE